MTAQRNKKYCSDRCKHAAHRVRQADKRQRSTVHKYPAVYRDLMKVIGQELEGADDPAVEFRALFTEAMRENVSTKVKDGLLGVGETVLHLLPRALAVVAKDMDSDDPLERARAAQFILKYGMNFKEAEEASNQQSGVITIVADRVMSAGQVVYKAPDTEFGREYLDEVQTVKQVDPGLMETCYRCGESKARGAMNIHDTRNGTTRFICKACYWTKRQQIEATVDVTSDDLVGDY